MDARKVMLDVVEEFCGDFLQKKRAERYRAPPEERRAPEPEADAPAPEVGGARVLPLKR